MLIQDMTPEMNIALLKGAYVGRIACAKGFQPYITPFSFVYHEGCIYSVATVGRRIEWMRANPLVCVEAEKIVSRQEWQTVVIFGRYQELTKSPEFNNAQVLAHDLLSMAAAWWEPGYVKTLHDGAQRPLQPVYFRILIDEISGHQGIPCRHPVESNGQGAWKGMEQKIQLYCKNRFGRKWSSKK